MQRLQVTAACGLLLMLGTVSAVAENLPDPTRPPSASESSTGQPPASTGLQSIIRSDHGKPAAIINGEYVVLGGQVGDARLVKIGEDSVTLKSASGTETLRLIPGVEKKPAGGGAMEPNRKGTRGVKVPGKVMK